MFKTLKSLTNSEIFFGNFPQGKENFYCLPSDQVPDSELLVDILNQKLQGDRTSEDVVGTVVSQLSIQYPC